MAKKPAFFDRYLIAVFRRGRAKVLPEKYLQQQAQKVLKGDELLQFDQALERLLASGVVIRSEEGFTLDKAKADARVAALKQDQS